jgi:histidinol-phosphatase (PHP family)
MLVDYHIHTPYCGHAQGAIVDYVENAIRAGLDEIAFTDHLGRYYLTPSQRRRNFDWGMDDRMLHKYVAELSDVRDAYADRIRIRIGLEIDYIEGAEHLLDPWLQIFPFDVALGSIHCLPKFGWRHISETSQSHPEQVFTEYFAAAHALVASGRFQSLAHLDFVWRYVKWPKSAEVDVFALITDIVRRISESPMAIEVNANGFLWSQLYQVPGGDPFDHLLDQIREYQAPITIGSDAHTPKHVGKTFAQLLTLLKHKGIATVRLFDNGVPASVPLG